MATRPTGKIEDQLERANLAINNSLADDEIKALVAPRGYTVAKLTVGKALYDAAQLAVSGKTGGRGAKENATGQVGQSYAVAHRAYQDLAQTARKAFRKDKAKLVTLGLSGPEPDSTAGFLKAAKTLFDNAATPAIQIVLQEYGYTPEFLASESAKITAFDQSDRSQEAAKGSSEGATGNQNKMLADMNDWVSTYLGIAQLALRDRQDLQEKIGIKVRNQRPSSKKNKNGKPPV
jgi:hypothetical protein